jgi:hypothetical protein
MRNTRARAKKRKLTGGKLRGTRTKANRITRGKRLSKPPRAADGTFPPSGGRSRRLGGKTRGEWPRNRRRLNNLAGSKRHPPNHHTSSTITIQTQRNRCMRKIGKIILPSVFKPRLVKKLQKRRNCYESADGRLLL